MPNRTEGEDLFERSLRLHDGVHSKELDGFHCDRQNRPQGDSTLRQYLCSSAADACVPNG
jgi:hypothetical protein